MYKILFVLFFSLTASVWAAGKSQEPSRWEATNVAGGRIVLTTHGSKQCNKFKLLAAFKTHPNGKRVEGCWSYHDGMANVVWEDSRGEISSYEPSDFTTFFN